MVALVAAVSAGGAGVSVNRGGGVGRCLRANAGSAPFLVPGFTTIIRSD